MLAQNKYTINQFQIYWKEFWMGSIVLFWLTDLQAAAKLSRKRHLK